MSSKEHAERLFRALQSQDFVEPRSISFGENRVAVLCRVQKQNEAAWIEFITNLLKGAEYSKGEVFAWQCHICRHYFLKENNSRLELVFGWNVSIQSREMTKTLDAIHRLMVGEPLIINPNEVTEFPLQAGSNRNTPKKGKGVHTIGGSQDFRIERTTK